MKKIALINGKYNGKTLNIMLTNTKVSGLGYVPEEKDEEIDVYDLKGCLIVPENGETIVLFKSLNAKIMAVEGNVVKGEIFNGQLKFMDFEKKCI